MGIRIDRLNDSVHYATPILFRDKPYAASSFSACLFLLVHPLRRILPHLWPKVHTYVHLSRAECTDQRARSMCSDSLVFRALAPTYFV